MALKMVSNLSTKLENKRLSSKTRNDIEYITNLRSSIKLDTRSSILSEWSNRYSEGNLRNVKRTVRRMEDSFHEGEAIHYINPKRIDRASRRMKKYIALNPYTRKALINQTLDIPYTESLDLGKDALADNFEYRDMVSGVSSEDIKVTTIYSDAEKYMDEEDRFTVLASLERIKRLINSKDE